MHEQLWGYKVEEKIYLGVRKRKRLNITALDRTATWIYSYLAGRKYNPRKWVV